MYILYHTTQPGTRQELEEVAAISPSLDCVAERSELGLDQRPRRAESRASPSPGMRV